MKITVLSENTTKHGLGTEHGLCLYIEACQKKILFDFGASNLFLKNADATGVDLAKVDFAVLSHGHSDHAGGLSAFLNVNSHAPIYVNSHALEPHYNAKGEYIGIDPVLINEKRLVFVENEINVDTGLRIFNCNHSQSVVSVPPTGHTKEVYGVRHVDDYAHEQYLLISEGDKRILLSGCSHKGILNIMEWVKPTHLFGGFHFSRLPLDEKLKAYANSLSTYDTHYYTCHCTGASQFEYLCQHMDKLNYITCGETVYI